MLLHPIIVHLWRRETPSAVHGPLVSSHVEGAPAIAAAIADAAVGLRAAAATLELDFVSLVLGAVPARAA